METPEDLVTKDGIDFKNEYVEMRDGVRIAVSIWTTPDLVKAAPSVLINTRYWRAVKTESSSLEKQPYYPLASKLLTHGYSLIVADARGSGASFGCRLAETDCNEVEDIHELIVWISSQSWCDGRVVTSGTSYSAITTLYSLTSSANSLVAGICRAPDFDMYRHLFAPGGIVNEWFIKTWGAVTAAQDANDTDALFSYGYWPVPESGAGSIKGVLPVGEDKQLLSDAVDSHKSNFNIGQTGSLECIDDFLFQYNPPIYDEYIRYAIERNQVPLVIRCGWHDAGTALGAFALYCTLEIPVQIVLGPWNHEGTYYVDPFKDKCDSCLRSAPEDEAKTMLVRSLDKMVEQAPSRKKREVIYFTLGENKWKIAEKWPLPETKLQRWFFSAENELTKMQPMLPEGEDHYQIDSSASTGRFNRWYAQSPNQPVLFPDRYEEDKKLLVYDSQPLGEDIEITGHPVVSLYLKSTAADGQFFVYLECIDSAGCVTLLTEGQLRGKHRKISDDVPPYKMFGPYHSLKRVDIEPMRPDEVAEVTFDLLPISVLLKKGQRIRVAVAGADADTFTQIPESSGSEISVKRNMVNASWIDIPVIPRCREGLN